MTLLEELGKEMDRPAKILFVDDEEVYREAMCDWLKLEGFEVVEAVDGNDGLQKLSEGKYDLIIADLVMPGMDGLGLLKAVRMVDQSIPVFIVSGHDDRLASLTNIENAVTSVASKTTDLAILLEHIKRLTRR